MEWLPPNVVERLRGSHKLGIFVRLALEPPLRVWFGINDIPAGIESVDEDGAVYKGGGFLQDIPNLEILINGVADRVSFIMSGVRPEDAEKLDFDDLDVRGRELTVGVTTLDDYYQPMSAIIPIWQGTASFVTEDQQPVAEGQRPTVTLSLSVGSGVTTRDRNSASLWSHAHQLALWAQYFPTPELQAANPPDMFCFGTARMARGVAPSWPRF